MSKKVLVVYATKSGSTVEVAEAVGKALAETGAQVDVKKAREVQDISAYDAVVVGAPITLGWHKEAMEFVKRHQAALSQKPTAFFITCVNLTRSAENQVDGVAVYQDPALAHPPKNESKLSFKEKATVPAAYLEPILQKLPGVKPVSVGFLGGKLDYGTLDPLSWLLLKLVVRAKAGDNRHWDTIHAWGMSLGDALFKGE